MADFVGCATQHQRPLPPAVRSPRRGVTGAVTTRRQRRSHRSLPAHPHPQALKWGPARAQPPARKQARVRPFSSAVGRAARLRPRTSHHQLYQHVARCSRRAQLPEPETPEPETPEPEMAVLALAMGRPAATWLACLWWRQPPRRWRAQPSRMRLQSACRSSPRPLASSPRASATTALDGALHARSGEDRRCHLYH